jgi:hypothetical protein
MIPMLGLLIWSIDAQKSIKNVFEKEVGVDYGVLEREYVSRLVGLGLGLA